jgi:hypothetical protein
MTCRYRCPVRISLVPLDPLEWEVRHRPSTAFWTMSEFNLSCVKSCIPEMIAHVKAYGKFLID